MKVTLPDGILPLQLIVQKKYGENRTLIFASTAHGMKEAFPALLNWNKEQRFALKVKCTDPDKYKLSPIFAIVEPGHYMQIKITRAPGPPLISTDKLAFQFTPVTPTETDPRAVWNLAPKFTELKLDLLAREAFSP